MRKVCWLGLSLNFEKFPGALNVAKVSVKNWYGTTKGFKTPPQDLRRFRPNHFGQIHNRYRDWNH